MSHVRQLNPVPPSFDALLSELVANVASQQSDKIMAELKAFISKEFAEVRSNIIERPLDGREMAAFLNISQRSLNRWISSGTIPPSLVHRVTGESMYMFPSQVVNHLKSL